LVIIVGKILGAFFEVISWLYVFNSARFTPDERHSLGTSLSCN